MDSRIAKPGARTTQIRSDIHIGQPFQPDVWRHLDKSHARKPDLHLVHVAFVLVFFSIPQCARAVDPDSRPADRLMRLVPADMAVTISVEDLRGHASSVLKSRLAGEFQQVPAVRAWFASEQCQQLERSRLQIETLLGATVADVRDDLLGDAVILALRLPTDAHVNASLARGLLLVQARDPELLDRLIRVINSTQKDNGELANVGDLERNGTTYHVREFPAGTDRPAEWYVAYPDGTFAFSNSEALIQSVVDRKSVERTKGDPVKPVQRVDPGLAELPRVKVVRSKLPPRALVRVFFDPRQVERLLANAPRPNGRNDPRVIALLERYLAAVDYAGAALTWNDNSIVIHTVETLNSSLLDPWIRQWAADTRSADPTLERVPPSALALAAGHVHGPALFDALSQIVPEKDQAKLANLETLLTGLLLGQDLRTGILALMGPSVIAYLDAPSEADNQLSSAGSHPTASANWPFPAVMVISFGASTNRPPSLGGWPSTASALAAIDNALRTVLAVMAMDEQRAPGGSRITTRVVAGATVTSLDPPIAFAYAVDRVHNRLVLATSPNAVARYLEHAAGSQISSRFALIRSAAFSDAVSYACVDFDALGKLAAKHRERLVQILAARQKRPVNDVERDLEHALALARLFRAGFITNQIDANATVVQRRLGLLGHEGSSK
jgi:hypothetical protein